MCLEKIDIQTEGTWLGLSSPYPTSLLLLNAQMPYFEGYTLLLNTNDYAHYANDVMHLITKLCASTPHSGNGHQTTVALLDLKRVLLGQLDECASFLALGNREKDWFAEQESLSDMVPHLFCLLVCCLVITVFVKCNLVVCDQPVSCECVLHADAKRKF